MKKAFLLTAILVAFCALPAEAQSIFEVKFASQAKVKVYQVHDSASADLIVYQVATAADTSSNNGHWYFPPFPDSNSLSVYFVASPDDADIKICYTSNPSSAGWVNPAKMTLVN